MGEGKLSQAGAKDQGILLLEGSVGMLKPPRGSVPKSSGVCYVWQHRLIFLHRGRRAELEASLSYISGLCLKTKQPNNNNNRELEVKMEAEMAKVAWGCYTVVTCFSLIYKALGFFFFLY